MNAFERFFFAVFKGGLMVYFTIILLIALMFGKAVVFGMYDFICNDLVRDLTWSSDGGRYLGNGHWSGDK